ncbi:MAG TPA: RidA family protein [Pirellulales bacterium]|nr:RidA family protein [Pirellulales bacterium]
MPLEPIRDPRLTPGHLPYSHVVKAGSLYFISGQASLDEKGDYVEDTFAGEMHRSLGNLKNVLAVVGLDLSHVAQVRSYVGKEECVEEYNRIYRAYFREPYPARTTLVDCLGDLKFEIDAIAVG